MPKIKAQVAAESLLQRHCSFVSTSKDAIPFSTHLTRFSRRAPYDPKDKTTQSNVHLGQRKLLMSEIQLLTTYYQRATKPDQHPLVLYIGAAPGTHLLFLHTLFPGARFILYDGAKFDPRLKSKPNTFELHNEFFTDDTCRALKASTKISKESTKELIFISDIRLGGDTHAKFESQVNRDNALQLGWVKLLKPKYSLLKFRLPYSLKHGDKIEYVKGKVFFQVWPPHASGETRLLVARANINKVQEYDFKTYEESLVFHNKYARRFCFPTTTPPPSPSSTFCTCYDCMAELYTLQAYSKLRGVPVPTLMKNMARAEYGLKPIPFPKTPPPIEIYKR